MNLRKRLSETQFVFKTAKKTQRQAHGSAQNNPSRIPDGSDVLWEVERIEKIRFAPNTKGKEVFSFLVKWAGYDQNGNSWQKASDFASALVLIQLIEEFLFRVSRVPKIGRKQILLGRKVIKFLEMTNPLKELEEKSERIEKEKRKKSKGKNQGEEDDGFRVKGRKETKEADKIGKLSMKSKKEKEQSEIDVEENSLRRAKKVIGKGDKMATEEVQQSKRRKKEIGREPRMKITKLKRSGNQEGKKAKGIQESDLVTTGVSCNDENTRNLDGSKSFKDFQSHFGSEDDFKSKSIGSLSPFQIPKQVNLQPLKTEPFSQEQSKDSIEAKEDHEKSFTFSENPLFIDSVMGNEDSQRGFETVIDPFGSHSLEHSSHMNLEDDDFDSSNQGEPCWANKNYYRPREPTVLKIDSDGEKLQCIIEKGDGKEVMSFEEIMENHPELGKTVEKKLAQILLNHKSSSKIMSCDS